MNKRDFALNKLKERGVIHHELLARPTLEESLVSKLEEKELELEKVVEVKIDEAVKNIPSPEKGDKGDAPTDEELIALITPLIPEAKDGETPTDEQLLKLIRPLIPEVKDGDTPSDEHLLSLIRPLIPLPQTIDEDKIIDDLLTKVKKDQILDLTHIKGAQSFIKDRVSYKVEELMHGGGSGSSGVTSVAKLGATPITGAVTLSAGSNITLTESGQNIEIASTGGGGSPGDPDLSVQVNVGGVFTGSPKFLYDDTTTLLTIGDGLEDATISTPAGSGSNLRIQTLEGQQPTILFDTADGDGKNSLVFLWSAPAATDEEGGLITFSGNDGNGSGIGGAITFLGGQAGVNNATGGDIDMEGGLAFNDGTGGPIFLYGGDMSGPGAGTGGTIHVRTGNGNPGTPGGSGGDYEILLGKGYGPGTNGTFILKQRDTGYGYTINLNSMSAAYTASFPDQGGIFYVLPDPGANTLAGWDDTDNKPTNITIGTGLTYTHSTHTLSNSASAVWGSITGTLSAQTDLQTALNAKLSNLPVKEDGSLVSSATTLNFIEPDTILVTDSPSGTARIDTSKYVLLRGRSGGQHIIGDTGSGNTLHLDVNTSGTVGDTNPVGIKVGDNITSIVGNVSGIISDFNASVNYNNFAIGSFGMVDYLPHINLDHVYPNATPSAGQIYSYLFAVQPVISSNGNSVEMNGMFSLVDVSTFVGSTGQFHIDIESLGYHQPVLRNQFGGSVLIDEMSGYYGRPTLLDNGTITLRTGQHLTDAVFSGSGSSIGDFIGTFIEGQTVTGDVAGLKMLSTSSATNFYGMYIEDQSAASSAHSLISFGNVTYLQNYGPASIGIDPSSFMPSSILDIGQSGSGMDLLRMFTTNSNAGSPVTFFDANGILTLGLASTQTGTLKFNGTTSGTVTLNPAAAAGTWTFTLPTTAGSAGQFLQTDGSGVTSWANAGAVVASNDLTGQNAAVSSVVTTTAPNDGNQHTYNVGGYITVTAISVNTITLQVTYTDETSTSRTQSFFGEGLTTAAVSTTGGFTFPPMTLRAKTNTAITLKTTIVGIGSETYDVGGYIMRIN